MCTLVVSDFIRLFERWLWAWSEHCSVFCRSQLKSQRAMFPNSSAESSFSLVVVVLENLLHCWKFILFQSNFLAILFPSGGGGMPYVTASPDWRCQVWRHAVARSRGDCCKHWPTAWPSTCPECRGTQLWFHSLPSNVASTMTCLRINSANKHHIHVSEFWLQ